jgi:transcription initiation factor IIE alpha subunit
MRKLVYLYRCVPSKERNNGLVKECNFEQEFSEGFHHCPVCGNNLTLTTRGKSVSEYMQEGLRDHGKTK